MVTSKYATLESAARVSTVPSAPRAAAPAPPATAEERSAVYRFTPSCLPPTGSGWSARTAWLGLGSGLGVGIGLG